MKRKVFSLILALAMAVSLFTAGASAASLSYSDTAGHWAESAIERWSGYGIVQGSNGRFDPNGRLTCAQLATILANLLHLPEASDAGFTDNLPGAWYYDAINRCAAVGILNGNGNGTVTPEAFIARERAMVMLARALGFAAEHDNILGVYADGYEVSAYARGYVAALVNAGAVQGNCDNRLLPKNTITRAEMVTMLDRLVAHYAAEDGMGVNAKDGGLVLVAGKNVRVVSAPAGTRIVVADGATGLTVNEKPVADGQTYIVPSTVIGIIASGGIYTPPAHTHTWNDGVVTTPATCTAAGVKTYTCTVCGATKTEEIPAAGHKYNNGVCSNCHDKQPEVVATENAWDALNTKLAEIKGNDGAVLVTAKREGTAYTLLLDVDAIQSGTPAFENDFLSGLATKLKAALDSSFGSYTLSVDNQNVYTSGTFNNTNLKNALFSVADGFFYTLSNMGGADGVYTYKTVDAKVTGTNAYSFTIAVQLKGEDVSKVKSLAGTLADHLQMEMLDSNAIQNRYGISVDESKAIVVTMEMPDKLMQVGVDKIGSGENAQKAFDSDVVTVSALLNIMNSIDSLDGVLGNNASDVNSVLTTVNNNANVVNKVLSKMTAKVTAKDGTTANFGMTFTPSNNGNAWKDFLAGVIGMVGNSENSVGAMKPNQFKVTAEGTYKDYYYAVPVTVTINLEDSMGFQATETVVVVMHIDFTKYSKTGTASVSAAEPTETPAAAETSAE